MEPALRARRIAATCGIVLQLGWTMLMFSGVFNLGDAAAFGISVALCGVAAALVHFTQPPERQRSYAVTILKSGLTWGLVWGLIGLIAGLAMHASLFETAGVVMGPVAGSVFGCLLALRARAEPGRAPELLVFGTTAGTLLGVSGVLIGVLKEGSFENWQGVLIVFVLLGALGGLASVVTFALRRISLGT
jgi:hypothetical protein